MAKAATCTAKTTTVTARRIRLFKGQFTRRWNAVYSVFWFLFVPFLAAFCALSLLSIWINWLVIGVILTAFLVLFSVGALQEFRILNRRSQHLAPWAHAYLRSLYERYKETDTPRRTQLSVVEGYGYLGSERVAMSVQVFKNGFKLVVGDLSEDAICIDWKQVVSVGEEVRDLMSSSKLVPISIFGFEEEHIVIPWDDTAQQLWFKANGASDNKSGYLRVSARPHLGKRVE